MKTFKISALIFSVSFSLYVQTQSIFYSNEADGIYPTSLQADRDKAIQLGVIAGVNTGFAATIYLGFTGNCTAANILGIGLAVAAAAAWPIATMFYKYHRLDYFVLMIQEDLVIREDIARLNEREQLVHHVARQLRLPIKAHGLIRSIYLAKKILIESYLDKAKWMGREAKLQLINQLNANLTELENLLFESSLKNPRLYYEQPIQEKLFDELIWNLGLVTPAL